MQCRRQSGAKPDCGQNKDVEKQARSTQDRHNQLLNCHADDMCLSGFLKTCVLSRIQRPSRHTYRNSASAAVAIASPRFLLSRLKAARTFSLVSSNASKGTFAASPAVSASTSERIAVTIFRCLPLRVCGTSIWCIVANVGFWEHTVF